MEIAVLITGVGSGSTGEQVYKALGLGRHEYRIVATNVDPARAVVAPHAVRIALPPASAPDYLEALAAAANAFGARAIVPGTDVELRRIAAGRDALARLTPAVPLANGEAIVKLCQDKAATAAALARAGFRTPRTFDCSSPEAAVEAVGRDRVPYPVVVKPKRGGGGSADVYVAQDEAELRLFAGHVLRNGSEAIVQEYVGHAEQEFTVGVLHYPDGSLGGSIALRRDLSSVLSTRLRVANRTGRAELGPSLVVSSGFTQGEIDAFPEVRAAAERIAAAIGSTGPLNVQGRLVGSELVVFEINPRFSGTEAMRAMAGWNGPEALIEWHLGLRPALGAVRPPRCTFVRTLVEYELAPPADADTFRWDRTAGARAGAPVAMAR
jgi:carbamoyl-phosphate synthase large subunit